MQNYFLRISVLIFLVFLIPFSYSVYQYYRVLHYDDPIVPYIFVEIGAVTIVRSDLAIDMLIDDQYNLEEKDIIITGRDTFATVTWPDSSQTRLGPDTRMRIDRMQVMPGYTSIEIDFALEKGKAWTNVVRTIYPGSYFRTKLLNQGVIAGVRGTTYDIDITRGYIRSVDHSVTLSDNRGNNISLLPGELVSVANILKKLGREVVDQTWSTMNQARDTFIENEYRIQLEQHLDKLSGKTGGIWDRFIRWVLSFFSLFDDLFILEGIYFDTSRLEHLKISKEQILRIYQKFQSTKFVQERDILREYINTYSDEVGLDQDYIQTFTLGAIWDQLSFSGTNLIGAEELVGHYTDTLDEQIQSVIRLIPVGQMNTKTIQVLRQIIR